MIATDTTLLLAPRAVEAGAPRAVRAVAIADMAIRVHRSLGAVADIWRTLEKEGDATVFQRLDWVAAMLRHRAAKRGTDVLIVEVFDAETGRTLMLWPMCRMQHTGYRVIGWIECGVCDYIAPLMAQDVSLSGSDADALWSAMLAALPPADLVRIDAIPATVAGRVNPLALLSRTVASVHSTSGLPIHGPAETLIRRVCPSSLVKELGMKGRRLDRRGPVSFTVAQTPEEVESMFDVLLEQRLARFRKLGRFDLLTRPDAVAFYHDTALEGLCGGAARLIGLRVGDVWVATCYGLVHGGAFHVILLSIAGESWNNCSPGLQLVCRAMAWAREQGLDYFDFTIGDHGYKSKIGGRSEPLFAMCQDLSLKGRLVRLPQDGLRDMKSRLMERHPALFERLRALRQIQRRGVTGGLTAT